LLNFYWSPINSTKRENFQAKFYKMKIKPSFAVGTNSTAKIPDFYRTFEHWTMPGI